MSQDGKETNKAQINGENFRIRSMKSYENDMEMCSTHNEEKICCC